MSRFLKYWAVGLLILLGIIIAAVNYQPGTWLTGWDNLHPEFDFGVNLKRSLFAVWQEYQGTGLLGGMGHATALPRELILWVFSIIIPAHLLRYTWTFLMLILGPIGVYLFAYALLKKTIPATLAGIFYLTNFATIQTFTVPFEAFVTHYAALPWLLWGSWNFLHTPNRRSGLIVTFLNLIFMAQAYIPTLFVVYAIMLGILCIGKSIKNIILLLSITFCVNAFWLLPFAYFTVTKSTVTIEAKINQMATEEVYLRNRAYGTILDTIQLKGFWMDTFDLDPQKAALTPVTGIWRARASEPVVIVSNVMVFAVVLLGIYVAIRRRTHFWIALAILFMFTMLTTDTPPFSWVNDWLRALPIFAQAFRFPFTKFSLATAFSYSIGLAFGMVALLSFLKHRFAATAGILVVLVSLAVPSYPLFNGDLFYEPLKLAMPAAYFDLFAYLKTKPLGRIANLPQHTYWGWSYYRWGYTGSGFLWYGIEQPILDRAFDVWSTENENYYWELSHALYAKDAKGLEQVLDKYDISYILVDQNIVSSSHNRAIFGQEIDEILSALPTFAQTKQFGEVSIYERITPLSQSFVRLTTDLPNIAPTYRWSDNDVAFRDFGDYYSDSDSLADVVYSYRSLFTKRAVEERELNLEDMVQAENLVYDTDQTKALSANQVIPCGPNNSQGTSNVQNRSDDSGSYLRFSSIDKRICLSFGALDLWHRDSYLVSVESQNIAGRSLLFSLINQTAKHTEIEAYLPSSSDWKTSYFILPPLGFDGLGYTIYLANDSIGRIESINAIKRIRIYRIPYQDLVQMRSGSVNNTTKQQYNNNILVEHPNPAYYKIITTSIPQNATLILSQSYDPGWVTWPALTHVLVNNWANGWILDRTQNPRTNDQIMIFFWPQILEWIGFGLLPILFIWAVRYRKEI